MVAWEAGQVVDSGRQLPCSGTLLVFQMKSGRTQTVARSHSPRRQYREGRNTLKNLRYGSSLALRYCPMEDLWGISYRYHTLESRWLPLQDTAGNQCLGLRGL